MRKAGSSREHTWPLIRDAAIELLYTHGFEGMNLRQLSMAVGLHAGSLYNYFDSKEHLLIRLITEIMDDMLAQIERDVLVIEDPAERMKKMVETMVVWHTKRRKETSIGHMELRSLPQDSCKAYVASRDRFERIFLDILVAGRNASMFHVPNEKIATMSVIAMLVGISDWYRPHGKLSVRRLVKIYQDAVLKMLGMNRGPVLP
jgi:AcrR family transcriptional regulator